MARVRTRLELRTEVRQRADMENSQFISDSEIDRYLNESISELYDIIVENAGQEYFLDTYSITTVGGQEEYSLPSDFYILKGVDAELGGPEPYPLKPYMFNDRHESSLYSRGGWGRWGNVRYRLMGSIRGRTTASVEGAQIGTVLAVGLAGGLPDDFTFSVQSSEEANAFYPGQSFLFNPGQPALVVTATNPLSNRVICSVDVVVAGLVAGNTLALTTTGDYLPQIRFTPSPTGVNSVTVWYIPHAPELTSDTHLWNGFNGWEEYAIVDAAIKCLEKEESDTSALEMRKQRLIMRIQSLAASRDQGFPETVTDARDRRSW